MKKIEELRISPTPWKIDYSDDINRVVNILDANNKTIVETDYGFYPPELPDARMMTAATKLYDALYDVVSYCESTHLVPSERFSGVLAKAKAALAEASGEREENQ